MPKNIHVLVSDDKHERLKRIKDWNDKTWLEVIERGVETLDDPTQVEQ